MIFSKLQLKFAMGFATILMLTACGQTPSQKQVQQNTQGGFDHSGIIGGRSVSVRDPEIVSTVGILDQKASGLCTGTLLSERLVLTAAHCLESEPEHIFVFFTPKIDKSARGNARGVKAYRKFDGYRPQQGANMGDIALILMEDGPGLPAPYAPVEVLQDFSVLQKGTPIVAVGYGLNKAWIKSSGAGVLRKVTLRIMDAQFTETEAAVNQSINEGVCSGDSGGPGYIRLNGKLYLWGVVSRGDSIPIPFVPKCFLISIYTRIDAYRAWIESASRDLYRYL